MIFDCIHSSIRPLSPQSHRPLSTDLHLLESRDAFDAFDAQLSNARTVENDIEAEDKRGQLTSHFYAQESHVLVRRRRRRRLFRRAPLMEVLVVRGRESGPSQAR